ncbi:MAG: ABC transporter ATP-binding protein, partial [Bifidobacterium longum]|nr:ABC transporter ATP-binding protein [Bifidobacterium longum]
MRAGAWPTAQFSLAHDGARRYFFISWNHHPGIRPGPIWRGIMNVQNPSASRGIAIQAVDLVKNYGTGSNMVHALRGVNVSFERGKFTAIM